MGWCNYLVLPKYKVAFELSKNATYWGNEDVKRISEVISDLIEEVQNNDDLLDREVAGLTTLDALKILNVYYKALSIDSDIFEKLFVLWFLTAGIEFKIIHEEKFKEIESEYHTIISPTYDGEL